MGEMFCRNLSAGHFAFGLLFSRNSSSYGNDLRYFKRVGSGKASEIFLKYKGWK
jgi:hypothetical protein